MSVAIPTLGRPHWVLEATSSVLRSRPSAAFEVLILDNGCDPALEQGMRELGNPVVRYIPVPQVGLHNGRHAAVEHARGEILAYLDDDVLVDEGWLSAVADSFSDPSVHLVGGPCRPLFEESPPWWLEPMWERQPDGLEWLASLTLIDGGETQDIDPRLVFGANFAIRKSTLVQVGGFHPDGVPWKLRMFRGDGETAVSASVERLGLRSVYNPLAALRHRVPKERLTDEYFERRALLQGISDSFTDIRGGREAEPTMADRIRRVMKLVRSAIPGRQRAQRALIERGYTTGYAYHQEMARAEPAVLEWVHRPDYWGAELPVIAR